MRCGLCKEIHCFYGPDNEGLCSRIRVGFQPVSEIAVSIQHSAPAFTRATRD
jgi:hypothetical protein